jgi:aldehyde dehydrogenase (NAD+)
VLTVDSIDEAIAFVNARPKPLSLYVYSEDEHVCAEVLQRTSSGGACVNGSLTQLLNPFLPFGGVGASGMGSYHGRATFETFSHHRSVMWRATYDDPPQQYPPYPPLEALKQALAAS